MERSFEIIATRTLDVLDDRDQPARQVLVHLGRPWQEPTGEWAVPYQVVGLSENKPKVYRVLGFDAIQALQGALLVIGGILAGSEEVEQGRLRWDGDPDLGFPVPAVPSKQ